MRRGLGLECKGEKNIVSLFSAKCTDDIRDSVSKIHRDRDVKPEA